ncbi:MAG: MMPL family transporter [Thermodesulfobacteriota bacterium]|nr:MAG: MMPL family transporter [Thermodesulfobacteriota bacterium]
MEKKQSQRLTRAYAAWVIRWRWPVLIACILAALIAGLGIRYFEMTADYRVFFNADNPELKAFNAFEDTYTNTDNVLFVLQPGDKDVFTRKTLEVVRGLTEDAWQIPYAIRVDSITNFQHTEALGDDLTVSDLVEDAGALTDGELTRVRDIALGEPALVNRLISADGSTTGVFVTLQFPGDDHTAHLPLSVKRAEEMAAGLRAENPGMTVALTGMAAMSNALTEASDRDLQTLVPVMYLVIIIFLLLLLRSVTGTVATLLVISLAVTTAVGLSFWFGMKMTTASAVAPIVILTLAIADCVHILMYTFSEMRAGRTRNEALAESLRVNTEPVFLTSLTTTIGFLSLNFSDSPPFHDLGNIAAMGVVAAWVFSMAFLPAFISILPLRVRDRVEGRKVFMERFGDFVVKRRKPLFWSITALTLLLVAFIPRIELNEQFVEYFDYSIPFRAETEFAAKNLSGPYIIEFSIDSGQEGGIANPEYLKRLEAFAIWLRAQPEVTHVNTFTDVMKRVNKSMHGDNQAWYRLPDKRNLAAQYLLLYEMSLPYGLDLNSQVSIDKSASRLTITTKNLKTRQIRDFTARAESWLVDNGLPSMRAKGTGTTIMFALLIDRNVRSMLKGTAFAFLLIALTLIVALRSIKLGLISLASNFIPVALTFGLWAILVGEMGIIASVITATSLGLIVDDTVHILSKYNRAKREHRFGTHDAVRYTFAHVGTALWATTLILVAGFTVLSFSSFKINSDMGVLTSITLVFALMADFLLLPPLLMYIDRQEGCRCATCASKTATGLT